MPELIARKAPAIGGLTIPLHWKTTMRGLDGVRDAVKFAQKARWGVIQLAAFPTEGSGGTVRDFSGASVHADDIIAMGKASAREQMKQILGESGIRLQIAYCANTLGDDFDLDHTMKVAKAGDNLGVESVVHFVGHPFDLARARKANTTGDAGRTFFGEMLAERLLPLNQMIVNAGMSDEIENCPMWMLGSNGVTEIGNWFSNPELWDAVLAVMPNAKLHFDPSHIRNDRTFLEENPAATRTISYMIQNYGRIFGIGGHLKDAVDAPGVISRLGVGSAFTGNSHTKENWQAKAPGRGAIDWVNFFQQVSVHAPQITAWAIELEDLDLKYTDRPACEAAFVESTNYLLDQVLPKVYKQ